MAAERGDDVLVAGDLVEGHWGADVDGTGFFGPVNTDEQKTDQVRRAGRFYYGEWAERYDARGLTFYPAIGDHEVGDNPWTGSGDACTGGCVWKRSAFPAFKQAWVDVFGDLPGVVSRPVGTNFEDTAYAVQPAPGVLLVSVDMYTRVDGDVHTELGTGELAWLDQLLDDTTAQTVIVQGHAPVIGPVRKDHSGGADYEGGKDSPFWQTLVEHQVDLYLAGHVHDVTMRTNGGVTQVTHGGLFHRGHVNYLTGDVYADGTINLELHRFGSVVDDSEGAPTLWATTDKRPYADVVYSAPTVTGTLTVGQPGTGELEEYTATRKKPRR